MGIRRCLIVVVGIAAVVAILFSGDVPEDFDDPWAIRKNYPFIKIVSLVFDGIEMVTGVDTRIRAEFDFRERTLERFEGETGLKVTKTELDGIPVHIYEPAGGAVSEAAVYYIHGGGFLYYSADSYQVLIGTIAKRAKITVVAVDYRMATAGKYPLCLDDCLRAYKDLVKNAAEYNIDPKKIAVGGDSAGGNLAAALSLKLRDTSFSPMPVAQVLIYPCLQAFDLLTPSYPEFAYDLIISVRHMALFWTMYAFGNNQLEDAMMINDHTSNEAKQFVSDNLFSYTQLAEKYVSYDFQKPAMTRGNATLWEEIKDVIMDPYFAPLMASDLRNLPEAFVLTVNQNVLRDDGIWYAQRLRASDNEVEHLHLPGPHGLLSWFAQTKEGAQAWDAMISYLQKVLKLPLV